MPKLSQITAAPSAPALTDYVVGVGPGPTDYRYTLSQITQTVARTKLTANTNYYVSHDTGNDSNDGSVGSPWATLQHANNFVAQNIDIQGFTITMHVADSASTYAGVAWTVFTGGGNIVWLGNNTTLGNVKIGDGVTSLGFTVGSFTSELGNTGTQIWISGFDMAPTAGPCLNADGTDRGVIILGEPTFLLSTKNKFSGCQANSYVIIGNVNDSTTDISIIDGNAINAQTPLGFISQSNNAPFTSVLFLSDYTVTGTVTFSIGFAVAFSKGITLYGTIGGFANVHGPKFFIDLGGVLSADSLTSLPGTTAGIIHGGLFETSLLSESVIGANRFNSGAPKTLTGTSGTIDTTTSSWIINPSGTFTVTLPSAVSNSGAWVYLKCLTNNAVNSASSDVVPIQSTTAGTAIISGGAGSVWANLQSDGINWIVMAFG